MMKVSVVVEYLNGKFGSIDIEAEDESEAMTIISGYSYVARVWVAQEIKN